MNPITLAICVYNCERYIEQTLQCVVDQTFQEFDLLIVDDCSIDGSVGIIKRFLVEHDRDCRIISLNENGGVAAARQMALESATTKYVIFVDSDDLPNSTLLEREYQLITSDENIMGVDCWSQFIDENSRNIRGGLMLGATTKEEYISRAERQKMFFYPIQCLFDREAALSVGGFRLDGFPEGKPRYRDFCEDLDLWTRMSDLYVEGRYMLTIPEVLYSYRKTGGGLSSNRLLMMLKMKFVKINLRRRRAGEAEITYIEYLQGISDYEMQSMKRDAEVATLLADGAALIQRGRIVSGAYKILKSIVMNPHYFWQKLKANSGIFKR